MSDFELTDDEEAVRDLAGDFDMERGPVISTLLQIQAHEGSGERTRLKAQELMKAIEAAWPRDAADQLRDAMHDDAERAARDREADARDEDAQRAVEIGVEIDALRR